MLDQLRDYIQTVLTVLLLAVVVDLLVPPRTGRHVRFVMGLVMAIAIVGPVLQLLGSDLEGALRRWSSPHAVIETGPDASRAVPDVSGRLWEVVLAREVARHADSVLDEMGLGGLWQAEAVVRTLPNEGAARVDRVDVVVRRRLPETMASDPVKVAVGLASMERGGEDDRDAFLRLLLSRTGLDPGALSIVWRGGG